MIRRCVFIAGLLMLSAAAAPAAAQSGCWCDPRNPGQLSTCRTDWTVAALLGGGFDSMVCNGAPPGAGGAILQSPHPCPELVWALTGALGPYWPYGVTENPYTYVRGTPRPPSGTLPEVMFVRFSLAPHQLAQFCPPIPDGPLPISIWPNPNGPKGALLAALTPYYRLLAELEQRLLSLDALSPQARGIKNMIASILGRLAALIQATKDPANPLYQTLAPAPVNVIPPPTGLPALDAWVSASQILNGRLVQFNNSVDLLIGAVLADQAGDVLAAPWVRRQARALDVIGDKLVNKGTLELNARAAMVAEFAPATVPAGCLTATTLALRVSDLFVFGARPIDAAGLYEGLLANPCTPGGAWPDLLLADAPTSAAAYAVFDPLGAADAVCTQTGRCSTLTTTTITPRPGQSPGRIKQKITVACVAPCQYPIVGATGLVVQVSIPGLPPVPNIALVDGVGVTNIGAPAGTYALTATFPESNNAKRVASSQTVTVQVAP